MGREADPTGKGKVQTFTRSHTAFQLSNYL